MDDLSDLPNELFTTPEEKEQAITIFRTGLGTTFWEYIKKVITYNIQVARFQLENPTKGQDDDIIRLKLKIYRDIISTPESQIKSLETPDVEIEDPDPYEHLSDSVEEVDPEVDNGEEKS